MDGSTTTRRRATDPPVSFGERMNNLRVSAKSPDGLVKATLTLDKGITVELEPRVRQRHDDASLAETITTTVRAVLQGYSKTVDGSLGTGPDAPPRPEPGPERTARRRRFMEAVARLDVLADSPRRLVKARMDFTGLHVRLRPGALSRIDVGLGQFTAEINEAIAEAHKRYRREYRTLRERF